MTKTLGLIPLFVLVSTIPAFESAQAGNPPPGNVLADLVEKVSDGVVNISSTRFVKSYRMRGMPEFFGAFGIPETHVEKQSSLGSGFIVDDKGYVLSNNHVVEGAAEVVVTLRDKRRFPAKIIGRDKALDLALLQIKGGTNLKPNALGQSDAVRTGESVFAIGNPFGLQHTVTAGIVSAKNRSIGIGPFDNFLQTDASINFGNSGGPLFNLKGEVIGINTAINAQGQGLGFAIPIDEARAAMADLKKYGYIVRAWLGVIGENITPALQYHYELPVDHGVVIARLAAKGPAAKLGLQIGDIVINVNGQEVKERADVQRALRTVKPGQSVAVKYNRRGKVITKQMVVQAAPDTSELNDSVI